MDAAERMAMGMVDAERRRRRPVSGAEVFEVDGLVLCLSNLPEPSINFVLARHEPHDPVGALAVAEDEFARRDQSLGIDLQVGRHPGLDRAVRSSGLSRIIERPGMSVAVPNLRPVNVPEGIEIRPATTEADAAALVAVDVEAFGGDPEIGASFFGAGARGVDGVHAFVAWEGEDPVAIAVGYEHDGAVGVMGVAVVPRARRRGIGSAVTVGAVRSFPSADLAWLHPTPEARTMYEGLGFRRIADHEVWVRHHPEVDAPT